MILILRTFPEEEFVCDIYPILRDLFVHQRSGKCVVDVICQLFSTGEWCPVNLRFVKFDGK
jgi:hypothetical protein